MHFTRSLKALFGLCVAAAIGSAVWMYTVYDGGLNTNRAYLGTDTRAQCLFIGCAIAVGLVLLAQRSHEQGRLAQGEMWRPNTGAGLAVCGALGIAGAAGAVSIWLLTTSLSSFPFSGGFFLLGLSVGGVIVAGVAAPRSVVPRFLALAPIRYVGRISYGLYIWHWPIFIWLNHERLGLFGWQLFAVRAAVTFAVSVVSFHLIERPIRMGTFVSQWRAWLVVPAGVGAVIVALVAATTTTPAVAGIPAIGIGTNQVTATTSPGAPTFAQPVRVLLFGDSIALTLGIGLSYSVDQDKYGYVLSDKGILGCGVVDGPEVDLLGTHDTTPQACNGSPLTPGEPADDRPWPYQWLDAMNEVKPNVVVLLAGRWEVADREYQGQWTNILNPVFAAYVKQQLNRASQVVTATGARMVFLTAPCTEEGEQPDGAPWPEDSSKRLDVYNQLVRQVAAEHPTTDSVVDLFTATCPRGRYATDIQGVAVRRSDGVHFTIAGGEYLAPLIMPPIVAAGKAQAASTGS
jgi:lysophospholipase L1-like esterase